MNAQQVRQLELLNDTLSYLEKKALEAQREQNFPKSAEVNKLIGRISCHVDEIKAELDSDYRELVKEDNE